MIVIGLAGKKKSGKSTVANYIKSLAPNRVHIISYADALKQDVATMCDVTLEFIEQNKDDFRLILQGYGTDYRRKHCGDDYWIKRALMRVFDISNNHPNAIVIIPDVRFPNEAQTIHMINGFLFHVNRDTGLDKDEHQSEKSLDTYDVYHGIINNNGTLESLQQSVRNLLQTKIKLKL